MVAICTGLVGGGPGPAIATGGGVSILKSNSTGTAQPEAKRRKVLPPPESRMVVYVRQENEEIFTPLHLVPPTVPGIHSTYSTQHRVVCMVCVQVLPEL